MGILLRLTAKIVFLLMQFILRAELEILGCMVRLLYWSVRTYGWGRVAAFFLALWLSVWVHQQLGSPFTFPASLGSIAFVTFSLWGIMVGGYLWLARRWRQGMIDQFVRVSPQSWRNFSNPTPSVSPAIQKDVSFPSASLASKTLPSRQETPSPCGTSLWEQVLSLTTLQEAWRRVLVRGGGPGSDGMTVETFALQAEQHLRRLAKELAENRYQPYPPRWVEVPKRSGGVRRLAILCVRDRIVQLALHIVLSSLWDKRFAPCSYAYRPGRSALQAVAAVERARAMGKVWVVDADIESFFDSVPHAPLFALLEDWLPDEKVRQLVRLCVTTTAPNQGRGIAQGAPLSPLLANLYLHPFDEALSQGGYSLIRYADDFVILCATRPQAEEALQRAERLLNGLGLRLNANKTRIVHWDDGFTFLGYVFTKDGKFPSEEAVASLQERLASTNDETKRRQILAGWKGYFGDSLPDFDPSLLSNIVTEEPVDTIDDAPWWSQEGESDRDGTSYQIGLYRERFLGRPDIFARYWQTKGRKGYAPVRRPVTDEELVAHFQGQTVLGTYLLHPDAPARSHASSIPSAASIAFSNIPAFAISSAISLNASARFFASSILSAISIACSNIPAFAISFAISLNTSARSLASSIPSATSNACSKSLFNAQIVANSPLPSPSSTNPATSIAPSTCPNSPSKNADICLCQSTNFVNFAPSQRFRTSSRKRFAQSRSPSLSATQAKSKHQSVPNSWSRSKTISVAIFKARSR